MKHKSDVRLINANPIVKFIVDGLNCKDPMNNLGYDGIRILTEIEFAEEIEYKDIRPEATWIRVSHEKCENGYGYNDLFMCSGCLSRTTKDNPDYETYRPKFCPECGSYMLNNETIDPNFELEIKS